MAKKKLGDRALIVLQHIADRSQGGHKWLPGSSNGRADYDQASGRYLNIGGSGDAAILRSLVSNELLSREAPAFDSSNQYSWLVATDAGRKLLSEQADRVKAIQQRMYQDGRKLAWSAAKQRHDEEYLREEFPEFYK